MCTHEVVKIWRKYKKEKGIMFRQDYFVGQTEVEIQKGM